MKFVGSANKFGSLFDVELRAKVGPDISVVNIKDPLSNDILPEKTIGLAENVETKEVVDFIVSTRVRHVVQIDDNLSQQMCVAAILINDQSKYLQTPSGCTLGVEGDSNCFKVKINSSKEKRTSIDRLLKFASDKTSIGTIRDSLALMADELITNALYNAPTDSDRNRHIHSHRKRTDVVELEQCQSAELFLTVASDHIMIGCIDLFGSIPMDSFLKRLQLNYGDTQTANINMGDAGAGIGCRMMIDHSTSFCVASKSGEKSVISCVLPVGVSMRSLENCKKSLHFSFN